MTLFKRRRDDEFSIYIDITNGFNDAIFIENVPLTAPLEFKKLEIESHDEAISKTNESRYKVSLGMASYEGAISRTYEIQPNTSRTQLHILSKNRKVL